MKPLSAIALLIAGSFLAGVTLECLTSQTAAAQASPDALIAELQPGLELLGDWLELVIRTLKALLDGITPGS